MKKIDQSIDIKLYPSSTEQSVVLMSVPWPGGEGILIVESRHSDFEPGDMCDGDANIQFGGMLLRGPPQLVTEPGVWEFYATEGTISFQADSELNGHVYASVRLIQK